MGEADRRRCTVLYGRTPDNVTGNLPRKLLRRNASIRQSGTVEESQVRILLWALEGSMKKTCRTCRKTFVPDKMICDKHGHWQCVRCARETALRGEKYRRTIPVRCPGCGGKVVTDPCVFCCVKEKSNRKKAV